MGMGVSQFQTMPGIALSSGPRAQGPKGPESWLTDSFPGLSDSSESSGSAGHLGPSPVAGTGPIGSRYGDDMFPGLMKEDHGIENHAMVRDGFPKMESPKPFDASKADLPGTPFIRGAPIPGIENRAANLSSDPNPDYYSTPPGFGPPGAGAGPPGAGSGPPGAKGSGFGPPGAGAGAGAKDSAGGASEGPVAPGASRVRFPDAGEAVDSASRWVLGLFRFVRVMLLWISFHFVDKAYQESYLLRSSSGRQLPRLWTLPLAALGFEAAAVALLLGALWLLGSVYKRPFNTFVIDRQLLVRLLRQYVESSAVILALGCSFGYVLQHSRTLRYREDGVRAVRALSLLAFYTSAMALLLPIDLH